MPPNWRCRNEPDISDGSKLRAGRVLPGNAVPQENRGTAPGYRHVEPGFYFEGALQFWEDGGIVGLRGLRAGQRGRGAVVH